MLTTRSPGLSREKVCLGFPAWHSINCHLILRGHQPLAPALPHNHHLTQQIHTWGTPSKPTQLASAMPHRVTLRANKCSRLTGSLTKWLVWGMGWISLGLQKGRVNFTSERLHYRTAWERGSPEYSSPALRLSCWKWDLGFPTSQAYTLRLDVSGSMGRAHNSVVIRQDGNLTCFMLDFRSFSHPVTR